MKFICLLILTYLLFTPLTVFPQYKKENTWSAEYIVEIDLENQDADLVSDVYLIKLLNDRKCPPNQFLSDRVLQFVETKCHQNKFFKDSELNVRILDVENILKVPLNDLRSYKIKQTLTWDSINSKFQINTNAIALTYINGNKKEEIFWYKNNDRLISDTTNPLFHNEIIWGSFFSLFRDSYLNEQNYKLIEGSENLTNFLLEKFKDGTLKVDPLYIENIKHLREDEFRHNELINMHQEFYLSNQGAFISKLISILIYDFENNKWIKFTN